MEWRRRGRRKKRKGVLIKLRFTINKNFELCNSDGDGRGW